MESLFLQHAATRAASFRRPWSAILTCASVSPYPTDLLTSVIYVAMMHLLLLVVGGAYILDDALTSVEVADANWTSAIIICVSVR